MILCMAAVILIGGATAFAADVPGDVRYLDENGQLPTLHKGDYLIIGGDTPSLESGWYVVKDSIRVAARTEVGKDVKIVLLNGARLECKAGIHVPGGSSLTIYGQSTNPNMAGKLIATGDYNMAGIGGNLESADETQGNCGTLRFYGGWIEATGGSFAAGIGTGNKPNTSAGAYNRQLYDIEIGGYARVIADAGREAAGIGSGNEGLGSRGDIVISGNADVTARGGKYGAGIGGGDQGANATITISGGTINAVGGYGGSGIGGGDDSWIPAGNVSIKGGTVNASGGDYAAGIGGGDTSHMAFRLHVSDGKVSAIGGKEAAGIGGGNSTVWNGGGKGGEVVINLARGSSDSFVYARAGHPDSSAIGHGDNETNPGKLELDDGTLARADYNKAVLDLDGLKQREPVLRSDRVDCCQNTQAALVQRCGHPGRKYSYIDENYHEFMCRYCSVTERERHTYDSQQPGEPCSKCNYSGPIWTVTLKESDDARYDRHIRIARGNSVDLPDCSEQRIPEGRAFAGWASEDVMKTIEGIDIDRPKNEAELRTITEAIGSCLKPGATVTPDRDLSYTALYVKIVTVSFRPGEDAGGSMDPVKAPMYSRIRLPWNVEFEIPDASLFIGWTDDSTGKEYEPGAGYTVDHEPAVLTARWKSHGHDHKMQNHKAVKATCDAPGSIEFWECTVCGKYFADKMGTSEIEIPDTYLPPTGHLWAEPVYRWSEDYSSVTAERTCLYDRTHTEEETVDTECQEKTAATCLEEGTRHYTARFSNTAFSDQHKEITTGKGPHTWGEWTPKEELTPAGAGKTILVRECRNCGITEEKEAEHQHSLKRHEAVNPTCTQSGMKEFWECSGCGGCYTDAAGEQFITDSVENRDELRNMLWVPAKGHIMGAYEEAGASSPTCEEPGFLVMQRSCIICKAKDQIPQTYTMEPLGHFWGEPRYSWSDDSSSVTARRVCLFDSAHVEEETAMTESYEDPKATCSAEGTLHYTARFSNAAFREQHREAVAWKLPHTWSEWTPKQSGSSTLIRTCLVCGLTKEKEEGHKHVWKHHPQVSPTCTQSGMKEFWECEKCGECYADADGKQFITDDVQKRDELKKVLEIPALGHSWGKAEYTWAEDNSKVIGACTCRRNDKHILTETVETTVEVIRPATSAKAGEERYTAVFTKTPFETQIKPVIIPAGGESKIAQKLTVKKKTVKIKAKKLKKKALKVKPLTVKGQKTKLTYKGTGLNKKSKKALKIDRKTGKIKVKKKTRKGTYKMKVTITAAGSAKYRPATKKVTVKIRVR